ncbi:hypothetical protein C1645_832644 [Glomus cerebriforme]|uniref:Uncharacterized protein n=1 Tax=Glomus cerebriforme TaxID=658196 RepID=A0A397SJM9_9GLOM|nr:hypothetical protein C1645_832644 [Glomus cerebriforme]
MRGTYKKPDSNLQQVYLLSSGWTSGSLIHNRWNTTNVTLKLLLRGFCDGFTPKKFHEICDNQSHIIIVIKVKIVMKFLDDTTLLHVNSGRIKNDSISKNYFIQ